MNQSFDLFFLSRRLVLYFMLMLVVFQAKANPFDWIHTCGDSGNFSTAGITADKYQNKIICGHMSGSIRFGDDTLTGTGSFIVKYDTAGNETWARLLKGLYCTGVSADLKGNIYTTGSFSDSVAIDSFNISSYGRSDFFIARFLADGKMSWLKSGGGPGNDSANCIVCDYWGNTYIAGAFENYVNFNPGISLLSLGEGDVFIAQYDSNGEVQWADEAGGPGEDAGTALAVDLAGHIWLTGKFSQTATFYRKDYTSRGGFDIFLTKYDQLGFQLSFRSYGGNGNDLANAISTDGSGDVFITGSFTGQADFDSLPVTAENRDIFVAMIGSLSGKTNWVKRMGGPEDDAGLSLSADGVGNVMVCGAYQGTSDFGRHYLTAAGSSDMFVVRIDAGGKVQYVFSGGGGSEDSAQAIYTDHNDNTFILGTLRDQCRLGDEIVSALPQGSVFLAQMKADPAAIASQKNNFDFSCYPNPSESDFYVSASKAPGAIIHYRISDALGQIIQTGNFKNAETLKIDLGQKKPGIYFIMMDTPSGFYSKKLIRE